MSGNILIQQKQSLMIKRMLAGDSSASSEELMIGDWKVLIYDRAGRDILLPLFSVAELRNLGITLHLLLHSDREPIPDCPAVYFVNPTPENLQRISRDLKEALYESFELNFISPIKRDKLEDLAQASLSSDSDTSNAMRCVIIT